MDNQLHAQWSVEWNCVSSQSIAFHIYGPRPLTNLTSGCGVAAFINTSSRIDIICQHVSLFFSLVKYNPVKLYVKKSYFLFIPVCSTDDTQGSCCQVFRPAVVNYHQQIFITESHIGLLTECEDDHFYTLLRLRYQWYHVMLYHANFACIKSTIRIYYSHSACVYHFLCINFIFSSGILQMCFMFCNWLCVWCLMPWMNQQLSDC